MIKKTIYIGNAAYLNKADEQLTVIYQEDGAVKTVPVEDLGLVVLDHQQITIT
jgi:CRISPR-associated protein Cas1